MTRKDYNLIANAIKANRETANRVLDTDPRCGALFTLEHLAKSLARDLRATNPRFDESRFLNACGVE